MTLAEKQRAYGLALGKALELYYKADAELTEYDGDGGQAPVFVAQHELYAAARVGRLVARHLKELQGMEKELKVESKRGLSFVEFRRWMNEKAEGRCCE